MNCTAVNVPAGIMRVPGKNRSASNININQINKIPSHFIPSLLLVTRLHEDWVREGGQVEVGRDRHLNGGCRSETHHDRAWCTMQSLRPRYSQ